MKKALFAQIFKVDEAKHEVWGLATQQTEDADGEIFNYDASKPFFIEWSENASKTTNGKSKGNIREMHQLEAVGKVIDIQFDDVNKRITIGTKIVSDSTWTKIVEGVLTGFSIGGKVVEYVKNLFTCRPVEISVVDLPCLPEATYSMIKADGTIETKAFQRLEYDDNINARLAAMEREVQALKFVTKAEGKTKRVAGEDLGPSAFAYVGDKNETSTWKLPLHFSSEEKSKRHVRNALARFNQTQGIPEGEKAKVHAKIVAAAKRYGIDAGETEQKAAALLTDIDSAMDKHLAEKGIDVSKSMSNITDITSVLQQLRWVLFDSLWEAEYEGEGGDERDSAIAVEVEAAMQHLIEILKDVVEDETSELFTRKAAEVKGAVMNYKEIQKKAKSMADHFRKLAAHHEDLAEAHKDMDAEMAAMGEMHKSMAAACKKAMDADEKDDDSKESHEFHKGMAAHCKAMAAEHGKCFKAHTASMETHGKMADGYGEEEKAAQVELRKAATAAGKEDSMTTEEMTQAITDGLLKGFQAQADIIKGSVATLKPGEPTVNKGEVAELVAKAVADASKAQEKAMTDSIGAAITKAVGAIDIAKMVADKVDETVKATLAAPAQTPKTFSLVPRGDANKAVALTISDDDDGM